MTQGLRPRATKKAQLVNCNAEQDPGQATKGRLVKDASVSATQTPADSAAFDLHRYM
jgi:hypothetical protein